MKQFPTLESEQKPPVLNPSLYNSTMSLLSHANRIKERFLHAIYTLFEEFSYNRKLAILNFN